MSLDLVGYADAPLRTFGYVSDPAVSFSDRDLNDLLLSARRFNALHGVTGKLVVLEDETGAVRRFAQVLEGLPEAVALAADRVRADPRHRAIRVVVDAAARARRFAGWDMAFETVDTAQFETTSGELFR